MTVKDVCQKYNVSRQTVYNRFKAAGLDIGAMKDPQTGHFTADGETVIDRLFTASDVKPVSKVQQPDLRAENAELRNRLDEVQAEKKQLAAMLERQQQIVEQQQTTIHDLTEQLGAVQHLLTAPQEKKKRFLWWKY